MVRPDIVLMGRKNKMTGVISIMEQNGVEAGMEHGCSAHAMLDYMEVEE
jgi:hypothetical protein